MLTREQVETAKRRWLNRQPIADSMAAKLLFDWLTLHDQLTDAKQATAIDRQVITDLSAENRQLKAKARELEAELDRRERQAVAAAEQKDRNTEREKVVAKEQQYHADERERTLGDLGEAISRGDQYRAREALERLRHLD